MKFSILLFLLFQLSLAPGSKRVKFYYSPDKLTVARILTAAGQGGGNAESSVEVLKPKGSVLGAQNFMSRDHEHGLGVVKAEWTGDSKYFVFSLIASGGNDPGHFPTFFYSREDNKMRVLDTAIGIWITDPDFQIEYDDIILVNGRNLSRDGRVSDTLSRAAHLSQLAGQ